MEKYLASLLVFCSLMSCSPSEGNDRQKTPIAEERLAETQSARHMYIRTVDNTDLASIAVTDEEIHVASGGSPMFGVRAREDKRKYYDGNDRLKYSVKYKKNSIKLKDRESVLLWKVKFNENGIKIADNELMENSFVLRTQEGSGITLKRNGEKIRTARVFRDGVTTRLGEQFIVEGIADTYALGVLLIEDLPPLEQCILIAELAAR